jgi:hypothetical protein
MNSIAFEASSPLTPMVVNTKPPVFSYKRALRHLAHSDDVQIKRMIAENRRTPSSVLRSLVQDKDENVRLGAAENPSLPYSALLACINDPAADLRYALAENHSLPFSILQLLSQDENPYVACRAAETLARNIADERSCA